MPQEDLIDVLVRFSLDGAADVTRWLVHASQNMTCECNGSLAFRFYADGVRRNCRDLFTWETTIYVLAPEIVPAAITQVV